MLDSLGLTASPILLPILCLGLWTLVMMTWMVVTRLPAISAAKLGPDAGQRTAELGDQLPKEVQWKADNYNHLMEQPTVFYAVAITLAVAGLGDDINTMLAWTYVGSRVVHSFVHATSNHVLARFSIFGLGSVVLLAMIIRGILTLI
ncbi:MAG: hypothetical protein ACI9FB_003533 [Candidatus Azotimanducaceae bacterium]|jgi:hypothetical protein